jgi:acid-sensing ion channel, other
MSNLLNYHINNLILIWVSVVFRISDDFINNRVITINHPNNKPLKTSIFDYPLNSTAYQDGLTFLLKPNEKSNYYGTCKFWSFTVHSPFELASSYDVDTEIIDTHFGTDVDVLITPEFIRTDEALRSYEPKKRDCYFEDERKLKFFKVYTKQNCEFECFAGANFETNCKPFHVPRDNESTVCDYRHEYDIQFEKFYFDHDKYNQLSKCNCLAACNSVKYKVQVFEKKRSGFAKKQRFMSIKLKNTDSTINFKMKDTDVIPMIRHQPLTFVEFLAQSGGMMGLFAGLSILSVIETFYFFSFRIICNILKKFNLN